MSESRGASFGAIALLVLLVAALILRDDDSTRQGPDPESVARPGGSAPAQVLRVVDGDTIEVELDGATEDVRYIGVDTPETVKPDAPVQCFGPQASARNHELVEGESVRLEFDHELRDAYGRLLAYVFVDRRLVNAALIRGGYARTLEIEPNTSRATELARLEAEAGEHGAGLWGAC